jgi:hypothetical protein
MAANGGCDGHVTVGFRFEPPVGLLRTNKAASIERGCSTRRHQGQSLAATKRSRVNVRAVGWCTNRKILPRRPSGDLGGPRRSLLDARSVRGGFAARHDSRSSFRVDSSVFRVAVIARLAAAGRRGAANHDGGVGRRPVPVRPPPGASSCGGQAEHRSTFSG